MHTKTHYVIFVPGLGGVGALFRLAANSWKRFGITPIVHDIGWKDGQQRIRPKLDSLIARIDTLHGNNGIISLVGTSAGGSAVLNAFAKQPEKIHRVVNICGRLRVYTHVSPSLETASRLSKSFRESVEMFERTEPNLSNEERQKILTIRSLYDETVPLLTIPIRGAHNIRILSIEHNLSIAIAMTIYSRMIARFLHE